MFAILFALLAQPFTMFAQRTEGFPLGGKKTASSLSPKTTDEGGNIAPVYRLVVQCEKALAKRLPPRGEAVAQATDEGG